MASVADCLRQHAPAYVEKFGERMPFMHRQSIPDSAWKKRWVVDMKPVGNGQAVLKYLAPYVHRVGISDKRIESCDAQSVTYRYTPTGENHSKTRTVSGQEFVRGFVQHVLPRGFQKVRYYGWMSPNNQVALDNVRWLVWLFLGWTYWLASAHAPQHDAVDRQPVRCAECGSSMQIIDIVYENSRTLVEHGVPYLDSG